jgi:hypothetical protein
MLISEDKKRRHRLKKEQETKHQFGDELKVRSKVNHCFFYDMSLCLGTQKNRIIISFIRHSS